MSAAAPTDRAGFRHVAALYGTDEEFLALAVPFLADGIAAGDPTLLAVSAHLQRRVQEFLGDPAGLTLLGSEQYRQPFTTLQRNYQLLLDCVGTGDRLIGRIRMIGAVPEPGIGTRWDGWVRYEAAINDLYAALPVWSICPYDTRSLPAEVLDDVERTHPYLAAGDGEHRPNPRYTAPTAFLAELAHKEVDPLESTRPDLALTDPSPTDGRRAVAALAATTTLDRETIDGLVVAVSEALANAIQHGRRPVELRAWAAPERVLVVVRDQGGGPSDPYAGYLPKRGEQVDTGLGLWIAHQICSRVTLTHTPEGFTVRLVAGTPHPVPPAHSKGEAPRSRDGLNQSGPHGTAGRSPG
jgi:anti-sigma regulatory factor (Ser/Thr protein kinase)